MSGPTLKSQLLELLQIQRQEEQRLLADLRQVEGASRGGPEDWSAKDVLAHITAWKEISAGRLASALRGEQPHRYEDVDHENAGIYAAHQALTWDELAAWEDRVWTDLLGRVQTFPDEDLAAPDRYTWMEGRPLWETVLGNGFWHAMFHVADLYHKRGDPDRGLALQERLCGAASHMEALPGIQGAAHYNLACFYALTGRREQALEHLRQSLALRPDLVEWSRQDPDLESLHADPAYQALYS